MLQVRHLDIYVSIFPIGLGGYVIYQGLDYGYVENSTPSGGFLPVWSGIGIVVFSAINLWRLARRHGLSVPAIDLEAIDYREIAKVLGASALMAGFIIAAPYVGMTVAIFILMLAIGALFGPRTRRFYIALTVLAVGMSALLYVTFHSLLGVPLI